MQQEDVNSLRIYYLGGDALFFFIARRKEHFLLFLAD